MIIADTSGLLAMFNRAEPSHDAVVKEVERAAGIVVSPYVVAELDYLLATRLGVDQELAALEELSGGAYDLPVFEATDLAAATQVVAQYRDLRIGLADASNVVLAARYETTSILTLDRRHFSALRSLDGRPFDVLPA